MTDPMTTGYDARAVANWFLDRAARDGKELTQLHLHKLVYLAHGWHLARLDRPLIRDAVEAWLSGPMIPVIYNEFKHFGEHAIRGRAIEYDFGRGENVALKVAFPGDTLRLLEECWETFADYDGEALTQAAAEDESPWSTVMAGVPLSVTPRPTLPNQLVKEYYEQRAQTAQPIAS